MMKVETNPRRRLSKECRRCHDTAERWIIIGDDNLRTCVALCKPCTRTLSALLDLDEDVEEGTGVQRG